MNYVFIPGAWHGGWSWTPVAHRVRAAGHLAYTLTMPGLTLGDSPRDLRLADATDHLIHEIESRDLTDVVLVGHSWAGFPITAAAPRLTARLREIVFFSAFVPLRGQSMLAAFGPEAEAFYLSVIEADPDHGIGLDYETFRGTLMPDGPDEAARIVFEQLIPQPGGYMSEALDVDGVATLGVPVRYLLAENDTGLAAPGPELAARAGVEPIMVPGGHEALLTHPDEIAKALLG
ncbi:alpha/beta fold hydrolase [Actinoplanes rectilineatus]|uniref:alpha/beta fold hydrolase n=1 Tax=Actinoplanes rectilineatus TaxID=113571 RepID=UPI0005F2F8AE|nr:alpha/beta hydrolase family protein [Actinoplanes rectilineatus]